MTLPCSAIFSQFPTDKGICCSFNMKAAEEIFNGETYVQLVNNLQKADTRMEMNDRKFRGKQSNTKETNPGKSKGLVVVIGKFYNCFICVYIFQGCIGTAQNNTNQILLK